MPTIGAQRFNLRQFLGVNRMLNARVLQPGSWYTLKNLYMPTPGRLQQRPGTAEFASKVVIGIITGNVKNGNQADDFPSSRSIDDVRLPGEANFSNSEPTNQAPHPVSAKVGANKYAVAAEDTVVYQISF